jgi:transposase
VYLHNGTLFAVPFDLARLEIRGTPVPVLEEVAYESIYQQAPLFALDFLPPYSPELNPIERVWKLTRRLCLHNRYFGFLESVMNAVEDQFAEWTKPNDTPPASMRNYLRRCV